MTNVWPRTVVQTCIIHLIHNTFRLTFRRYWDELKRDVKPIYTAVNATTARAGSTTSPRKWGGRYPAVIRLWDNAWADSSDALPRRRPLMSGRASRPRIRLKQAQRCRG